METMKGRERELRKVNVVYFISRDGKVEQPHLIRVQQLHSHGVHLRDVKRWLSALRGDGMPDSFAWSFKRRYKNGYVWQDLRDDDLITPFSDTEYILKGSELLLRSVDDRQRPTTLDMSLSSANTKNSLRTSTPASPPPPPPQSQDTSDESSTHSAVVFKKQKEDELSNISNCNSSTRINNNNNNNNNNNKKHTSKNNDSRPKASRLLHNLIHCGTIDTSDSILQPVICQQISMEVKSQSRRSQLGGGTSRLHDQQHEENSGHRYSNARKRSSDSEGRRSWRKGTVDKTVRVVYRLAGPEPNCSQCGNNFKPDKLHAHMKSCRVLKAKRRKEKELVKGDY
ncbi:hypothetical protein J5N97_009854 [Dioscorea zingiberensis]|uniref:SOSEKI DIX-like domain-containing protein n=1 Tax=Dioscorea zingiberensis TaxID=325984 RepID=A0A9D5CZ08_9LILI|nr:hypothetical protein J5N97_009854 [Dioscorea zingiberensis]